MYSTLWNISKIYECYNFDMIITNSVVHIYTQNKLYQNGKKNYHRVYLATRWSKSESLVVFEVGLDWSLLNFMKYVNLSQMSQFLNEISKIAEHT